MIYSVSVNFAWSLTMWFSRCWTEGYCFEMRKECVWTNVSKFLWWYFMINGEHQWKCLFKYGKRRHWCWKADVIIIYLKWSKIVTCNIQKCWFDIISKAVLAKGVWTPMRAGWFFMLFCHLLNLFQNQCFQKFLTGIPSKCQTVWIQFRMDILSALI